MRIVYVLLFFSLVLAGCSSAPQAASTPVIPVSASPSTSLPAPAATASSVDANPPAATASSTSTNPPAATDSPTPQAAQTAESPDPASSTEDLIRTDAQGAVIIEVTPMNLTNPGESLEFEVGLNTHSVDLSMDLATMATITTDTGKTVQASQWDGARGGHHVGGKLLFPAAVDGQPLLDGAKTLTLTIKNLDAPERVFSWDLKS